MKKLLLILLGLLLFASCQKAPEEAPVTPQEDISQEETEGQEDPEQQPEAEQKGPLNWYAQYFSFEVPEFPDADRTKLPVYFEYPWDNEAGGYVISTAIEQYFCDHEEVQEIAQKIYLADGFHINTHHEHEYFEDISEANNDYLLYSALRLAPFIETGMMSYNYNSTGTENADNVVCMALEYIYAETGMQVIDAYYAEDVEYIFHYLYGQEAEFVPEGMEMYGFPYVESAGIFLNFFDSTPPAAIPQVISI